MVAEVAAVLGVAAVTVMVLAAAGEGALVEVLVKDMATWAEIPRSKVTAAVRTQECSLAIRRQSSGVTRLAARFHWAADMEEVAWVAEEVDSAAEEAEAVLEAAVSFTAADRQPGT